MFYKAIVIGAGPAGLFAAYNLSENGVSTLVIEKNKQLGRKLLVSGNGQCNFTNASKLETFTNKYGDNFSFIKHALNTFTNKDSMNFFNSCGIELEIANSNKVFPKSRNSEDILGALVKSSKLNGTQIKAGIIIDKIIEYDGIFQISTIESGENESFTTENLIIATGGSSYSHLGTDGFGYEVAKQFGHKIMPIRSSLTNIIANEDIYFSLSGVSFKNVELIIWRNGKKIKEKTDDLIFTHTGISGPVILNSSRWIQENDLLTFNLINKPYEILQKELEIGLNKYGKEQIGTYLKRFEFPKSFIGILLSILDIAPDLKCANISKQERKQIAMYITKMPITVKKVGDLKNAMVTAGGVSLKEVNPTTFESRKQKGLYFVGEVLDIDADTGGYNIQAAMSMGCVCANNIVRKEKLNVH
ncbi:hypothetical protein AN641_08700 [Candidatus Epulonipiscioides gigas]|nr:hypothetical protein AN641_08700 [Epulopiscium sp. SCG-C07WGA-EpuloA2]